MEVPRSARLGKDLVERPLGFLRGPWKDPSPALGSSIPATGRGTSRKSESESDSVRAGKRRHAAEIKFRAVLDVMTGRQSLAQVAHVYQVQPRSLKLWKKRFLERGADLFEREFPDGHEAKVNSEAVRTNALDAASLPPDNQRHTAEFLDVTTLSALLRPQAD